MSKPCDYLVPHCVSQKDADTKIKALMDHQNSAIQRAARAADWDMTSDPTEHQKEIMQHEFSGFMDWFNCSDCMKEKDQPCTDCFSCIRASPSTSVPSVRDESMDWLWIVLALCGFSAIFYLLMH